MIITAPVVIPISLGIAMREVTVLLTREGLQTSSTKYVRLLNPTSFELLAFISPLDGVNATQRYQAAAVDNLHILLATDEALPRLAAARYPRIAQDVQFTIDLNDGTGGAAGEPALLSGKVRVDGVQASRELVAVERAVDNTWRVAGSGRSDVTGYVDLDLRVSSSGEVYAVGFDDWGAGYQPNLQVTAGQTIRPSQYSGWLYRITEPGTLPATEPQWWAAEGDNAPRLLGTARAIAVRYYQPLAHGPVPVEII